MITVSQKYELLVRLLGPGDIDSRAINAQFWCPFCKHADSRKRKLAVRLADGVTHCWVCNWSAKTVTRLAVMLRLSNMVPELTAAFGDGGVLSVDTVDEASSEDDAQLPTGFSLVTDEIDRGVTDRDKADAVAYLSKRGVSYATAKSLRLGLANEWAFRRRVIFPSFDSEGELNYVTARSIDEDVTFKYFNTRRQRANLIFNEVDVSWSRELVLVEGPFDLASCLGLNAAAMLGSWLDEDYLLFNRIVTNRTPVCLAFDPDAAGKQVKVATRLLRYGINVRVVDWPASDQDADPAKVGQTTFRRMVKEARPFDESTAFRSRLNRVLDSVRLS